MSGDLCRIFTLRVQCGRGGGIDRERKEDKGRQRQRGKLTERKRVRERGEKQGQRGTETERNK